MANAKTLVNGAIGFMLLIALKLAYDVLVNVLYYSMAFTSWLLLFLPIIFILMSKNKHVESKERAKIEFVLRLKNIFKKVVREDIKTISIISLILVSVLINNFSNEYYRLFADKATFYAAIYATWILIIVGAKFKKQQVK